MSPLSILNITKKFFSKKLKKRCVMLSSRSVLLLFILKICKKIDYKQVNKFVFIPVTSKKIKYRYMSFQKFIYDFLRLNPHVALFISLEALKNSHSKKNVPFVQVLYVL